MIEKITIKYPDFDDLKDKINELVDAVNGILDYAPLEMAMKAEPQTRSENVQPVAETRSKNVQDELERTRKAWEETLQEFITKLYLNGDITDEQMERYKKMLITALEQKD